MNVNYVFTDDLDSAWPLVKPLIDLTADEDNSTESVYNELRSGQRHLWFADDDGEVVAAMTTSFVTYPTSGKMCRVETLAGNGRAEWWSYLPSLEQWAKENGCVAMDIFGRKGFEKLLKPHGYDFNCVLLRKRL